MAIAEGYAFAAKAGIDLQTTFEATRGGFAGGPMYDNKVPKIIKRDYTPGARIAVHRKDILNAKHYAHKLDIDTPLTDVVLHVMDWMNDNGHIDEEMCIRDSPTSSWTRTTAPAPAPTAKTWTSSGRS